MIFAQVLLLRKLTYMVKCRQFAQNLNLCKKRGFGLESEFCNYLVAQIARIN